MDNHTSTSRAEAERLLGLAERLLTNQDLTGSKHFAILAQEAEPLLEGSDQIMAIIEVLSASQTRLNNHPNWYTILQVDPKVNDFDFLKKQYRRLALLLHPDKNKFAFAESAFHLVADAWSVVSDPVKKSGFDNELGLNFTRIDLEQSRIRNQNEMQTHHNAAGNDFPINSSGGGGIGDIGIGGGGGGGGGSGIGGVASYSSTPKKRGRPKGSLGKGPRKVGGYSGIGGGGVGAYGGGGGADGNGGGGGGGGGGTDGNGGGGGGGGGASYSSAAKKRGRPKGSVDKGPRKVGGGGQRELTFWIGCPYCYCLFEYPRKYEGCCMRCVKCKKGFTAEGVGFEPPVVPGREEYYCSWGMFPMGFTDRDRAGRGGANGFANLMPRMQNGGKANVGIGRGGGGIVNIKSTPKPKKKAVVPVAIASANGAAPVAVAPGSDSGPKRKRGRPRKNPVP